MEKEGGSGLGSGQTSNDLVYNNDLGSVKSREGYY